MKLSLLFQCLTALLICAFHLFLPRLRDCVPLSGETSPEMAASAGRRHDYILPGVKELHEVI